MKKLIVLFPFILGTVLVSCEKKDLDDIENIEIINPLLSNTTGLPFDTSLIDSDISSSLSFKSVNTSGNKHYNQLIVNKKDNHPVLSGDKSLRFHIKPGDCGTNSNFSDCDTDRSRVEIYEQSRKTSLIGQEIVYEYGMYIPKHTYIKPLGDNSILVLSQIFFDDPDITGDEKGQFYLIINDQQELQIQTHIPFTYNIDKRVTIESKIYDKWLKLKIAMKTISSESGIFTVSVNGIKKLEIPYDFIPDNSENPQYFLKVGIYNAFVSRSVQVYREQVVYYDEIERYISE